MRDVRPWLMLPVLSMLGVACATTGGAAAAAADPLELGPDVRTVAVGPLAVSTGEVDDALRNAAPGFTREMVAEVERALSASSRYQLVTGCPAPCPTADATLLVGFEARRLGGFTQGNVGMGRNTSVAVVQTGDLPGVDVQVVARAVRSDGTVIQQRGYMGTKLASVSGRQFSRGVVDLTRDALADASRKLTSDLNVPAAK